MCGIFGYYNFDGKSIPHEYVVNMGNSIQHRGPDGQGIYHDENRAIALGNQRLAILDIEHGKQPFISDDGNIIVVQNGEIFNHIELAEFTKNAGYPCKTHCDTEVILRLYEMEGIDCLNKLNGMFAIAIYDIKLDSLFLARDRVGEKPLYYSNEKKQILFGSEIKSFLPLLPSVEINYQALDQYLAFNYVPMPLTMFKGVSHVKPGHYVHISNSIVNEICWWDLLEIKVDNKPETQWIDEFNFILDDSVRLRLRSDVDFGAFLSGGVDSSTVVGLMSKHIDNPVKTYCIGFDDPKYDESPYAEEAAIRFGTQHKSLKVEPNLLALWPMATYHSDQPHGDVSFLPTYKLAELASYDVKMVLTGDGADELFAGYDKYLNFFTENDGTSLNDEEFSNLYANYITLFDDITRKSLFSNHVNEQLSINTTVESIISDIIRTVPSMDRINQALYIDTKLLLSGNNLVKPDRMGMAVSIENRAPFLDYRMIELAFSMPGNIKLKDGVTKYIYKKAVKDLIGDNLAYRKKQMFTVPVGEWFKTELFQMCKDLLISEKAKARNIFNYDFIETMLYKHASSETNYTREIRALMAFEYWCQEFLD